MSSMWLNFKTTIALLIKSGKFEQLTETLTRHKTYLPYNVVVVKFDATCTIKIKEHDPFTFNFVTEIIKNGHWKVSEKDEQEAVSKARRYCLDKIRKGAPSIFDGLGILAEG